MQICDFFATGGNVIHFTSPFILILVLQHYCYC